MKTLEHLELKTLVEQTVDGYVVNNLTFSAKEIANKVRELLGSKIQVDGPKVNDLVAAHMDSEYSDSYDKSYKSLTPVEPEEDCWDDDDLDEEDEDEDYDEYEEGDESLTLLKVDKSGRLHIPASIISLANTKKYKYAVVDYDCGWDYSEPVVSFVKKPTNRSIKIREDGRLSVNLRNYEVQDAYVRVVDNTIEIET